MKLNRPTFLFILLVGATVFAPRAHAWGCQGHYITALIAEKHLTPHARAMVRQILDAGPIDPTLLRYCKEVIADRFADSSTWADDQRSIHPSTAGWHFIDIPREAPSGSISPYCPESTGCVTKAIVDQLVLLHNPDTTASRRADALRYIIHFIGDIHQPLHTTSNNDRGGNCVPVDFWGRAPVETNVEKESFLPNLHSIWDSDLITQYAGTRTPQQLADDLDSEFKQQIPPWLSGSRDPRVWAWESHEVAEQVVYGLLPNKITIEKPVEVSSCADDEHIALRMLSLKEKVAVDYQNAATPIVSEQLTKAGIRLAAVLNELWP